MTVKELKTNNMGYTPYEMKGHTLKGIKQRGVPFTGGVGSNEMEGGVGDKFSAVPFSKTASPNKGLWDSIKKIGGKMLDPLGLKNKAKKALGLGGGGGTDGGGKIKAMDARISALEQGSGDDATGGDAAKPSGLPPGFTPEMMNKSNLGMLGGGGGGGDPMLAGGGPGSIMEMMMKRKKAKQASWGGVGAEEAGV